MIRRVLRLQTRSGAPTPDLLPSMGAPAPRRAVTRDKGVGGVLARDVIETRRDLNPDLLPSMETPAHTGPSVSCRPGRGLNPDLLPSLGAPAPRRALGW